MSWAQKERDLEGTGGKGITCIRLESKIVSMVLPVADPGISNSVICQKSPLLPLNVFIIKRSSSWPMQKMKIYLSCRLLFWSVGKGFY